MLSQLVLFSQAVMILLKRLRNATLSKSLRGVLSTVITPFPVEKFQEGYR